MHLVDDCNPPTDGSNKQNLKIGDTYRSSGSAFTYKIQPTVDRGNYHSPIDGECYCTYETKGGPHLDCDMFGRGWWGTAHDKGDGLKDSVEGCNLSVC